MVINAWLVLDPEGDRPYLMTREPSLDGRARGTRILHYVLHVPHRDDAENGGQVVPIHEQVCG